MLFWNSPINNLEYSTSDNSFEKMKETLRDNYTATFWEGDINFLNVEDEFMNLKPKFPESDQKGIDRAIELRCHANDILAEASRKGENVCYLCISHGHFIDCWYKLLQVESELTAENPSTNIKRIYEKSNKKIS